jgi:uncharacterized protein YuzE
VMKVYYDDIVYRYKEKSNSWQDQIKMVLYN